MNDHQARRPTRPRLSAFAANLLEQWRRLALPTSAANIVVAVSGGADSTALLLGLDELLKKEKLTLNLIVAHLDHGLRPASRKDALWVKQLASELGYEIVSGRVNLKSASQKSENLEQAARDARYKFLLKTATKTRATHVLTAHTLDDQAETVLLRLLRGSAAEGLSGTPAIRELKRGSDVLLVRPLLAWAHRSDTEDYCRQRQIEFRVDEMNDDEAFSRVRIRKQLLPLMKSFNNRVVEAISRTASLLNEDAAALAEEADRLLQLAQVPQKNSETTTPSLSVSVLLQKPPAVRRRALREWILRGRGNLKRLEMVHLVAVEKLLTGERGGRIAELPDGMKVTRKQGVLQLSNKKRLKMPAAPSKIRRG
ncbi:MAG TPA: tRNA lysidine(34) synthetase TilS [Pyrinomonadaceae bacterium]|jgi:tRNA(Ile)-lysidine synthase|nr:tRNA lysidine(34) synthetase TilS [Pyrinomonadaceae bacterium]